MRIRSLVVTLALAVAALGGPTLLTSAANTEILGLPCESWIFVGDVCKAIEYCWETEDPACEQMGNESSIAPRQDNGY